MPTKICSGGWVFRTGQVAQRRRSPLCCIPVRDPSRRRGKSKKTKRPTQ
jgi:hypothetical protein